MSDLGNKPQRKCRKLISETHQEKHPMSYSWCQSRTDPTSHCAVHKWKSGCLINTT